MSDRSRLPKWAQREIERLELRLQEAREEVEKATAAAGLRMDESRTYGHLTPIERHDPVTFTLVGGDQVTVRVARQGGKLELHTGDGALVIYPRITNGVEVDVAGLF